MNNVAQAQLLARIRFDEYGQSGQVPTVRVAVEMTAHSRRSQRARTPKKKDNHTYCFLASTLLTGEIERERGRERVRKVVFCKE